MKHLLAIDALAAEVERLKAEEAIAIGLRREAEANLHELLAAACPDDGSRSFDGATYRVTITRAYDRKVSRDALAEIIDKVPQETFELVFDYEPKVNLRALRDVQATQPGVYAVLAEAITTKPRSPAVKVTRLVPTPQEG